MLMRKPGKIDPLLPVLAFCSFLVGFNAIATVPLLPSISASTDMPLNSGGLLYASYAAAYAVTAPVMGWLSDRLSRKGVLLAGLALFALSTAFVGTGETFAALILFRVLTGIGAGIVEPVVCAIAGDHSAYEARGRVMGIITAALIASSVIGVPLAGAISEAASWRWTFGIIAILALLAMAAALAAIPARRPDARQGGESGERPQFRLVVSSPPVFFSLLGSFLYYGALQGMFPLAGVFYHTCYGLGAGETGLVLLAAGAASVAGSLLGGKWADRRRKNHIVAAAGAAAGR
jgi:predicted MFS family arabinose efflux permease